MHKQEHLTPSSESPTAKDFAGNSQSIFKLPNLCELPRSIVIVTGPAGSSALAWKHMKDQNGIHRSKHAEIKKILAQKVLELPSTALLAP